MTYYKVLVDGQSAHGGDYTWSLPTPEGDGFRPGDWTPTIDDPVICERGWHLTTAPMQWPKVGMTVYASEPGRIMGTQDDKIVTDRARLLRPAPEMIPDWWHDAERFIRQEIPATPFYRPDGDPDPTWKLFTGDTWDSARDSAWVSAWDSAWDSARDSAGDSARASARDAALYVVTERICAGLPLAAEHRAHARARWNVWRKGYALLCDVGGILYVYAGR